MTRLTLPILLGLFGMSASTPASEHPMSAFVKRHCLDCHSGDNAERGLRLDTLPSDLAKPEVFGAWVRVFDRVEAGEMPPADVDGPTKKARAEALADLDEALRKHNLEQQRKFGRVVLRRLNRTEYEHTLRDLLRVPQLDVQAMLPADPEAAGFDNVGKALNLSYVQMTSYLRAAESALGQAIAVGEKPTVRTDKRLFDRVGRFRVKNGEVKTVSDAKIILRQPNTAQTPWKIDAVVAHVAGRYRLRLSCFGLFWDDGKVKPADRDHVVSLYASLNKKTRLVATFDVPNDKAEVLEATAWLEAGEHINVYAHTLSNHNVKRLAGSYSGPGLGLEWFEMHGPLVEAWPPDSHRRLFGELPFVAWYAGSGLREPTLPPPRARPRGKVVRRRGTPMMVTSKKPIEDAERLLRAFMERAFRRPVEAGEVARYLKLVRVKLDDRECFHEAMRTGYKAVLCSPDFLFFREEPAELDDCALASRLSYFLWRSMPDDILMSLAKSGKLHEPGVLKAQTERLLNDPKSRRFVEDFTGQWLDLRRISFTEPDADLYPEYDTLLLDSMVRETHAYFDELLRRDLGIDHVVAGDFAMLNARLAELYGVAGVKGVALRKVALPRGSPRGGFLTQASVLKVTANGTTTSPVTRGAWIRDRILGQPVPPPPPGVGSIDPDVRGTVTIREQLDKHRDNLSCAVCHTKIDPPGFALESFDVMGGFRTRCRSLDKGDPVERRIGGKPVKYRLGPKVDASGKTESGLPFADIHGYRKHLLARREVLARNLASRLLVFATGGEIQYADRREIDAILTRTKSSGYGLRSLVHAVVAAPVFARK